MSILSSLDFTKSVGKSIPQDSKFNDVSDIGGFPFQQNITRINQIDLFADSDGDNAVIFGLEVLYTVKKSDSESRVSVIHGITSGSKVGTITLQDNQILVGASGRHKSMIGDHDKDGLISCITLYVYNKDDASTTVQGPFGSTVGVGSSWASYGPIIAFDGTTRMANGLSSLGFVKLQAEPDFGIF